MKKDFIRDDRKVRRCISNIAKMNIFEFIYYHVFYWGYFKSFFKYVECNIKDSVEYLTELVKCLVALIINFVAFVFTPITLLLTAITQIKNAKTRMERHDKNKKD